MDKYLVRNFKWRENLGKVPAKVYRLGKQQGNGLEASAEVWNGRDSADWKEKRGWPLQLPR